MLDVTNHKIIAIHSMQLNPFAYLEILCTLAKATQTSILIAVLYKMHSIIQLLLECRV